MAQDIEHISLEEFLRHVAESLERARQASNGVVLEDQGNTYRIIFEGGNSDALATRAATDPFLALGGAFESAEPSDVTNQKLECLAAAYQNQRVVL